MGNATGRLPAFSTTVTGPRRKASTDFARSRISTSRGAVVANVRRTFSALRYSSSVDPRLPVCASTVRPAHSAGIGSHGCLRPPKPNGALVPFHGIGTRQWSRHSTPVRNQAGSCRSSSGTSTLSRPSSSPW